MFRKVRVAAERSRMRSRGIAKYLGSRDEHDLRLAVTVFELQRHEASNRDRSKPSYVKTLGEADCVRRAQGVAYPFAWLGGTHRRRRWRRLREGIDNALF
jgi:hypothetical protein